MACNTTGDVLFKDLFPSLSIVSGGTITLIALWTESLGYAVKGIPGVAVADSVSNNFTAPGVGLSYDVEVRIVRGITDISDNRRELTAGGVTSIVPFVVKKEESFYVEVQLATVPTTNDYILWKTCAVTNSGGTSSITSETNNTNLRWHVL